MKLKRFQSSSLRAGDRLPISLVMHRILRIRNSDIHGIQHIEFLCLSLETGLLRYYNLSPNAEIMAYEP